MLQRHDVDGPAVALGHAAGPDLQPPALGVPRDPQLGIGWLGRFRLGIGPRFAGLLRGIVLRRLVLTGRGRPRFGLDARRCRGPFGGQRLEVGLERAHPQGAMPPEAPDAHRRAREQLGVGRAVRAQVGRERDADLLSFQDQQCVNEPVRLLGRRRCLRAGERRRHGGQAAARGEEGGAHAQEAEPNRYPSPAFDIPGGRKGAHGRERTPAATGKMAVSDGRHGDVPRRIVMFPADRDVSRESRRSPEVSILPRVVTYPQNPDGPRRKSEGGTGRPRPAVKPRRVRRRRQSLSVVGIAAGSSTSA